VRALLEELESLTERSQAEIDAESMKRDGVRWRTTARGRRIGIDKKGNIVKGYSKVIGKGGGGGDGRVRDISQVKPKKKGILSRLAGKVKELAGRAVKAVRGEEIELEEARASGFPFDTYVKINGKLYAIGWTGRLDPREYEPGGAHAMNRGSSGHSMAMNYAWWFKAEPRTKDDRTIGRKQRQFYIRRKGGAVYEYGTKGRLTPVKSVENVGDTHSVTGASRHARLI